MRLRFLSAPLVLSSFAAVASGFDSGPQGARVLGLGGANTAYAGSIAGMALNPGLLGEWADSLTRVSVGGLGQVRRASFVSRDTYLRTDQDFAIQPGGYAYATHGLSKRVAVGLAVNTPYGYHTKWPDTWEGRAVVQESQLNTVFVQPTVGLRISDNFSVGAGFTYAYGRYQQHRALGQFDNQAAQSSLRVSGSGVGVSAGLYGRTGDNLAFGISYNTGVRLKLNDGTIAYSGVPDRDAALYPATSLRSDLNLPSTLSVGLADRVTRNLLLTVDFTLSGWSTLDSLNFDLAASGSQPATRIAAGRGFEDALACRIGAEYVVTPRLTVLGGVSYDETPVRDEFVNPEFVDANRLGGSAGLSLQLTSKLALEAAYSFSYGQLRTARVTPSRDNISNIAGTYRLATNTAALGISVAF